MSIAQSAMKAEWLDPIKDGERKTQKRTRPGAPAPETGNEDGGFRIRIDSRNYRKHPDKNKKMIRRSLKENWAGRSIVVDNTGESIGGSGVLEQAEALGLKKRIVETDGSELVVVVRKDIAPDDPRRKSLALADNATTDQSKWDFDALAVDWKPDELQEWGIETDDAKSISECETYPDAVPEVPEDAASVPGTVYQLGKHRLLCGDATKAEDVARLMGEEKANLWLTDPPYNVAYEGSNGITIENDNMEDTQFRAFIRDAFQCVHDRMEPGASFYIFHAALEGCNFLGACHDIGLKVRQCLIWKKNAFVLGRQDYQWLHEPVLYGWKDGAAHAWYGDRSQTTVMEYDKPKHNDVHPTMKPVDMLVYLIKNSSRRGEFVIDTFGGSGSTLIACEQTGRVCRMMELDPKYCDVIRRRWAEFTSGEGCDWQSLTPAVNHEMEENANV